VSTPSVLKPVLIVMAVVAGALQAVAAVAAPPHGTVTVSRPVEWNFGRVGGRSGATSSFDLTVKLPGDPKALYAPNVRTGSAQAAYLTIVLKWTGGSPDETLGLSATDAKGNTVGNDTLALSNSGGDVNVFMLQMPRNETYTITASNQLGVSSAAVAPHAVATLRVTNLAALGQPPAPAGGPGFANYHIPLALMPVTPEEIALGGRVFGEPSIGVDPRNDIVMYQAGLYTIRATFTPTTPSRVEWVNVTDAPLTNTFSEDAILAVDRGTGRTLVSQLEGACTLSAVSDNDGETWIPAAKACQTPPAVDHQTIGAGPFAPPLKAGVNYPDAVYFCSQNVAYAACAISLDGGFTYGAASPIYNVSQCYGLHGHLKVAPDGTIYVPNKACGAPQCLIVSTTAGPYCHPAFAVSRDNAASWTVHAIDDGHFRYFNTGDPSIGIGSRGTVYFGYGDRDGHPKVVVCTDHGNACGPSVDVGKRFHIENTEMAEVVAGDDNRAAFAFLGSTTPGDDQEDSFVGTWHLYVAITYDHGRHWRTVDATPNYPVQRGCIEFSAPCPSDRGSDDQRNLLDFNDMTIDREGRILVAYTDGCFPDLGPPAGHGPCRLDPTRLSGLAPEIEGPAIARQSCGLGLYAEFDWLMPACPAGREGL
jgi:hypothetical protein